MVQVTALEQWWHPSLTSGPVKYEAELHSKEIYKSLLVFVCVRGYMQGTVWIEPDQYESMLHVEE